MMQSVRNRCFWKPVSYTHLIEETDKIMKAQMARGADFETGNLMQRAKSMIPLLVPLFVSAFRRATDLAMAMEARCYSCLLYTSIIIAYYVIKALNSLGFTERPIKILFAGDEEIAHENSTTAETLVEEAKNCEFAFNMETGLTDGSLCVRCV